MIKHALIETCLTLESAFFWLLAFAITLVVLAFEFVLHPPTFRPR